jgi:hypothetical protein
MALELHHAVALAVDHADPNGIVPTTASAVLYAPDGTVVQTLTVTKPTWTTTVASGTTRNVLTLAAVTGITVGAKYRVTSQGVRSVFTVAQVDAAAKTVTLVSALQDVPDTGSTVAALTMTASLAAPGESRVGPGYRLDWQYADGTTPGFYSQSVVIVRWKWSPPATVQSVREHLQTAFRIKKPDEYCGQIADRANSRIDRAVLATNRRPYLYGDHDVWTAAGQAAVRYELALDGMIPQGSNTGLYQDQLRRELDNEIKLIIASLQDYDRDNSGTIDTDEAKGLWWSVETTR